MVEDELAAREELSARLPADDSRLRESACEHAPAAAATSAGTHPNRTNRGTIEAVVRGNEGGVERRTTRVIERNGGLQWRARPVRHMYTTDLDVT
jgi:hypothetical protein